MVGNGNWGVMDKGGGGVVNDGGNMMEDRVGNHLVAHLSGHLNNRLDERGVCNSVGNREDGSDRCNWDRGNCVGQDRGRGDGMCEDRGGVGEKRGGYREGVGVSGVGQQNGGVGFRPGQAKRGNGENSKHALHSVCWTAC